MAASEELYEGVIQNIKDGYGFIAPVVRFSLADREKR